MRRKIQLGTFLFGVTILLGSLLYPTIAKAEIAKSFGAPQELGTPVSQISLDDAAFGEVNGVDYMYTTESGNPAVFNVVNLDTNELVDSFPLEGTRDSWTHVVDSNGDVYLTATGKLYKYSHESGEIKDLGKPVSGSEESYVITLDDAGNVYGGTFPDAEFYKYDASTEEITNYGSIAEGHDYIRSLAYYDGNVYAGTGAGDGSIIKFNTETEEKTKIEFPDRPNHYDVNNISFVYGLNTVDHYLFAHLKESNVLLVYDLEKEIWLDETFDNYRSLNVLDETYNGKAYFVVNSKIYSFDVETEIFQDTGITYNSFVRGVGWITVDENADFPGKSMAFQTRGGNVNVINFETNARKTYSAVVKGQPTTIQAMEKGPDGKIYISGFRSSRGAIFDPETQKVEPFSLGQAERIGNLDDKMYFGVYPSARVYEMDTTQSNKEATEIFDIAQGQDRPNSFASGGNKLFIGTVPTYGELGGALSVYDKETDELNTYRNVVENQSVTGLAYKDGKLYGSTSVWGGLGIDPTEEKAKIFVWDVEKGEKITEFVPELDVDVAPKAIGELSFGPNGLLWGAALGTIFAIDTESNEVVKDKTIEKTGWDYTQVWRPRFLKWGEDGYLYTNLGTNQSKLNIFDPVTLEHITLQDATLMTLGDDGNIYYSSGAEFKMIPVYDGPAYSTIQKEISLINPSFEDSYDGDDIPGWNVDRQFDNAYAELSTDRAFEGNTSLKLTDTTKDNAVIVSTDEIPVVSGVNYTSNMKVYLESGRSLATFHFYNENGDKLEDNSVLITSGHGKWQDVTLSSIAPEGASYAKVSAMVSNFFKANVYFDAFSVTYEAYETTPEVIGADNGTFYTAETNPTLTVKGDKRSTIIFYHGEDAIATVDSTGEEQAIQLNGLAEGENEIIVKTIYENGKVSLDNELVVVVDKTAPDAPVVMNPTKPLSTNNRTPEVTIETEAGAIVSIVENGEMVGTSEADETGTAVVKLESLSQGIHKMKTYVTDKAGNESSKETIPHIIINNGKKPN